MKNDREILRRDILSRLDLSTDITDQELKREITRALDEKSDAGYLTLTDRVSLYTSLYDSFRGLDVLSEALRIPGVTEVMANGWDKIFIERNGRIERFPGQFSSREKMEDVVQAIASRVNRHISEAHPIVDARLEDGSRVNLVIPPAAVDGPVITIRRFNERPPDMEQLIAWGALSSEAAKFCARLVRAKYNIFISGGTGSGKTTFLGALAGFIGRDERVITIEDNAELRLLHVENLVRMESREASDDGQYEITIQNLAKCALRQRPDRIIIGEIRGEEALVMLQAMNTGHSGSMSTGHSDGPADMLSRLETMVLMGSSGLPLSAVRGQMASALDIIVHLGRLRDKSRKVLSISEVKGMSAEGTIELNPLYKFQERGEKYGKVIGEFVCCGELIHTEKLKEAGLL